MLDLYVGLRENLLDERAAALADADHGRTDFLIGGRCFRSKDCHGGKKKFASEALHGAVPDHVSTDGNGTKEQACRFPSKR